MFIIGHLRLATALRNFPVRNNPECNIPERELLRTGKLRSALATIISFIIVHDLALKA